MIDVALCRTKQDNGEPFYTLVNPVTGRPLYSFLLIGTLIHTEEEIRQYAEKHGYRITNTRKNNPPRKSSFIKHRV